MVTTKNKCDFGPWQVELRIVKEWPKDVLRVKQVHGSNIVMAQEMNEEEVQADGIIMSASDVNSAGIYTADCLPLVITTPKQVLMLHISRKTLLTAQLEQVPSLFSVNEITDVFIGPHICPEHFSFEYKGPEIEKYAQLFPAATKQRDKHWHLDLRQAVQKYFDKWEIKPGQVKEDGRCTFESPDLPSHKRSLAQGRELTTHMLTIVSS